MKRLLVMLLFVTRGFGQGCLSYGTSTTLIGTLSVRDEAGYNHFFVFQPNRNDLAKAAEDGRALLIHAVNTMERHFRDFITIRTSPGLVLIAQERASIGQAIDGLALLWEALEGADLQNRVCLFPSMLIY